MILFCKSLFYFNSINNISSNVDVLLINTDNAFYDSTKIDKLKISYYR